MKYKLLLLLFVCTITAIAQTSVTTPALNDTTKKVENPWKFKSIFGLNGSQTSFVNWAAGGRNNVSVLGFIDASLKYNKQHVKWDNDLKFALGGLKYIDSTGKQQGMQKTDDKIDLASTFGYRFKKHWFYTVTGGFKTQSLNGFNFPNDSVKISTFMAPGYLSISFGIEYAPKESFNLYFSPLAGKTTVVRDKTLANAGAFGVDKATYDQNGLLLTFGSTIRNEFGSYLRFKFQKKIMENIEMKTRIELFSNYINNPQNIDINAENIFAFKVNKWFSASLQWNLQYDDDIIIRDVNGKNGPRTQFKSVLGLGISYTLTN
ncbi:MAG: DUF3078 domain-containing protein [Fluviicola sp.]|nr:DUF3078 domain-containing protein [Fluviicola sp.]MBP6271974.1 DUF3078 domain-containing protein [Fluviicola sp.]